MYYNHLNRFVLIFEVHVSYRYQVQIDLHSFCQQTPLICPTQKLPLAFLCCACQWHKNFTFNSPVQVQLSSYGKWAQLIFLWAHYYDIISFAVCRWLYLIQTNLNTHRHKQQIIQATLRSFWSNMLWTKAVSD